MAACGKDGAVPLGDRFTPRQSRNHSTNHYQIDRMITMIEMLNFVVIGSMVADKIYSSKFSVFYCFSMSSCLVNSHINRIFQRIFTYDGLKMCLLGI